MANKKPELYHQQNKNISADGDRCRTDWGKIAVWNSTYYRSKGKRKRYVIRETNAYQRKYVGVSHRYTRWQLDYDLKKPWHVDCSYPKDFASFAEAIEYATSKEAVAGPFKYLLNTKLMQHKLWSGEDTNGS